MLLLLIVVFFALDGIKRRSIEQPTRKNRALYGAIVLFIGILFLDSIIESPTSKTYVLDAAKWIRTHVEDCAVIATDHQRDRLRYYSNTSTEGIGCLVFTDLGKKKRPAKSHQWLILQVDNHKLVNPRYLKGHKHRKIKEFLNSKEDGYFLYRLDT